MSEVFEHSLCLFDRIGYIRSLSILSVVYVLRYTPFAYQQP